MRGGGGSASTTTPSTYDIAAASTATASSVGFGPISAGTADTAIVSGADRIADMTASVGDTWRLIFNSSTNAFALKAISSAYGLSGSSPIGTLTKSVSGNIESYTGNFGTATQPNSGSVSIQYDTRTRSLIGSVTWINSAGTSITSDVTGTSMATNSTSISGLAGNYVFANQARNQSDGQNKASTAGTLNIDSTGIVSFCPGLKFSNGACLKLDGTAPTDGSQDPVTAQLTATSGAALTLTTHGTKTFDFGSNTDVKVLVQAGDLGPVLVIDQDWLNSSSIRRTGVMVAARIGTIDSAKFAGTFNCPTVQIGSEPAGATLTVTSTTFSGQKNSSTATANVALNKIYDVGSAVERDFAGAFHMTGTFNGATLHQFGFALSSSLFVFQNADGTRLNFCHRV